MKSYPTLLHTTARLGACVAILAGLVFLFKLVPVNSTTVSLAFLLAVLGIATAWGIVIATIASFLALLAFNYFFLPPFGTFAIEDPHNWVALLAFLVTATTASQLSARAQRRTADAIERRREVERLYELGQALLLNPLRPTSGPIVNHIMRVFEIPAATFFSKAEGEIYRSGPDTELISDDQLREAAEREDPSIDAARKVALVPVRLGGQSIGSLGFSGKLLSDAALQAVANLAAIGIERAKSQEEANRFEAERQSELLKSTLLDGLAHDFKTPLTSIKGALSHLLDREHDAEEKELLTLANEETDRLNRLVVETIELARIDAKRLHPERYRYQLSEIVSVALGELEGDLKDHPVKIEIPPALPLVTVDFDFIEQVIKQLVGNAARYSPSGSSITVSAMPHGEEIIVSVIDEGRGIEEDEQSKIFEKHFRGRQYRSEVPGTGLGLSIAKGVIEAHGGRIWVNSQPRLGSVFSFTLPIVPAGDFGEPTKRAKGTIC